MLTLINPVPRAEPFDHSDWVFEAKFEQPIAMVERLRPRDWIDQRQHAGDS
jgi:hypothetical protein